MSTPPLYDYVVVRVVPRVDREEFINVGVIVACPELDYLEARIALDEHRLLKAFPWVDIEIVREHLAVIPRIADGDPSAGPIARLGKRERFHWLSAPRSTVVQTSPRHSGFCNEAAGVLDALMITMVEPPVL